MPAPTNPPAPAPAAEALESALLRAEGFSHAFFGRRGGVSSGAFASLSFSVAAGDDPASVAENRARAAKALGVPEAGLLYLSQVHGADVHRVSRAMSPEAALGLRGDAVVSSDPRVAAGVRTADCVPVLVADRASGAVAAAHAGWKGVEAGVVAAAVRELLAGGGVAASLVAAIGPHIEACCFEVGVDVAERLAAASPAGRAVVRAAPPPKGDAHALVDLRGAVRAQLEALGLDAGAIDDVRGCTACDAERFFSYRRDGARSGRHVSAIVARG